MATRLSGAPTVRVAACRAATSRLLAADAAALAAWDAGHPDQRAAEREAEREERWTERDGRRGAA